MAMQNQIPLAKAFEIIGQQQIELVVLQERLAILQAHQCEPCQEACCIDPGPPGE
jgi:hypothetical protein